MKPIHEVIKHTQTAADDRREWAGTSRQIDALVSIHAARSPTGSIYDPRKPVKFGKKGAR